MAVALYFLGTAVPCHASWYDQRLARLSPDGVTSQARFWYERAVPPNASLEVPARRSWFDRRLYGAGRRSEGAAVDLASLPPEVSNGVHGSMTDLTGRTVGKIREVRDQGGKAFIQFDDNGHPQFLIRSRRGRWYELLNIEAGQGKDPVFTTIGYATSSPARPDGTHVIEHADNLGTTTQTFVFRPGW